ncbi:MAG: hypothetical protein IT211_05460 [Armatimonadetes bacterium]|nr:hypothetical protein [Armatimonadota bacterium]
MNFNITIHASVLLLLLLAALPFSANAQGESPGAKAFSSPDGNVILFGESRLYHPGAPVGGKGWIGFNIYRRAEGESDFRKINAEPVSRAATLAEAEREHGHVLDLIMLALDKKTREDAWKMFQANNKQALKLSIFNLELQEVLGMLYRDRNVEAGKRYEYSVTFVNKAGDESKRSDPVAATYGTPASAGLGPANVKALEQPGKVEVTWEQNGADIGAFTYRIYRAVDSASHYIKLNHRDLLMIAIEGKPGTGAFTDTGLIDDHTYWYAVASVDFVGNESRRVIIKATPSDKVAPLPPGPIVAQPSGLGILVTWKPPVADDLASYDIYRSTNSDSLFQQINDAAVPATDTMYEDRKALPNMQYFYRMVSIDRAGNRSEQSAHAIGYYRNFRPPLPPQYVTATGNQQGVRIEWDTNDEPDLQGYFVYRSESLNGELTQVSQLISKDTNFYQDSDSHLSSRATYWYLVQAINYSGFVSRYSVPTAARPELQELPLAPLAFRGWSEPYGNRLFWGEAEDNIVNSIIIERAPAATERWERVAVLPTEAGTFTDSTAEGDVEYLYRIRAISDYGVEGNPTQFLSMTRYLRPLPPPGSLMATKGSSGAKLEWDPALDDRVSGYVIYRKTGTEKAERISETPLPADTRTFDDQTIERGKIYFYSVAAIDRNGRESLDRAELMYELP